MRKLLLVLIAIGLLAAPAFADNGAPNGSHYNLNIIGVPKDKTADMTDTSGHVIFVRLDGKTTIWLTEGPFQVLDMNGTDGSAAFQLPDPDPTNSGTSAYSVYARYLGKPGGTATMVTCATDPLTLEIVCSTGILYMDSTKRPQKFTNVTKNLLYIYYDFDGDGVDERVPLFSDQLVGYFWDYDNHGLKLAQLRFYPIPTTVP